VWCRTTRVQSVICSILLTDIKSNRACDAVRASAAYLDYIGADSEPAERLVAPRQIAEVTAAALEGASRSSARDHRGRAETARSRRESGPWIAGLDLLGR
jgi:hypothetical protein